MAQLDETMIVIFKFDSFVAFDESFPRFRDKVLTKTHLKIQIMSNHFLPFIVA